MAVLYKFKIIIQHSYIDIYISLELVCHQIFSICQYWVFFSFSFSFKILFIGVKVGNLFQEKCLFLHLFSGFPQRNFHKIAKFHHHRQYESIIFLFITLLSSGLYHKFSGLNFFNNFVTCLSKIIHQSLQCKKILRFFQEW